MTARFSKVAVLRYAQERMKSAATRYQDLCGKKIDPRDGTAQCARAADTIAGINMDLLVKLNLEYERYTVMRYMIIDLELE